MGAMELKVAKYRLELKVLKAMSLPPYRGSIFRGSLAPTFKKGVCTAKDKSCSQCSIKNSCVYYYVFETPPPRDKQVMRRHPYVPHPFVIDPPLEGKREYKEGDSLSFEMLLIGKAIDYLPYFIFAFDQLGRVGIDRNKGKYELVKAYNIAPSGEERPIYEGDNRKLHPSTLTIDLDSLYQISGPTKRVRLRFLTPTRIKHQGRMVMETDLRFDILIRSILRRASALAYFHCDKEWDLNYKEIIDKAKKVRVVERNLRCYEWERFPQDEFVKVNLGGFMGDIEFEGDLTEFMPFLRLGELLHVGKSTSFGLGKYKIIKP